MNTFGNSGQFTCDINTGITNSNNNDVFVFVADVVLKNDGKFLERLNLLCRNVSELRVL
jgi:hypothetical protein